MEALDLLSKKLDLLLKKHAATEADNKRLRETVAAQNKSLDELGRRLSSLEKDLVSVHIGHNGLEAGDNDNMRRQLDSVIAEIDKILNTLND